jgi:5-methylcytosine-specific restriction endonuclease McrA
MSHNLSLKYYEGFWSISLEELRELHVEQGFTHKRIKEDFDIEVGNLVARLRKAGIDRFCDTCRREMPGTTPTLRHCSKACEKLEKDGSVMCPDCGLEIRTIGRWISHTERGVGEIYEEFDDWSSIDTVSWRAQRQGALHRADGRCERCGDDGELDVHHIIKRKHFEPTEKSHALENLAVVCQSCHNSLEQMTAREAIEEVSL